MTARFCGLALVSVFLIYVGPATAQTPSPLCVTGCGGGGSAIVYVTPDGQPIQGITGSNRTVPYVVHNIGTVSDTYTLTCSIVGGNETCGTVSPSSLTLAPESTATVNVTFTPGSAGTSGTVQLEAVGSYCNSGGGQAPTHRPSEMFELFCTYATDSGTYNVTNIGGLPPTAIALRNQNGDNNDRSLCLLSSAGEAGAWECGDLIITHGMPGYATMGHERSLTLLYNSATAAPHPIVAVAVTDSSSLGAPVAVFAELLINGVIRDSASYTAWSAAPITRQIALTFDASSLTTGAYPFQLVVQNRYSGGAYPDTVAGNLLVVNRSQSQLGAGWSFAGVEQLYFNQPVGASNGSVLWVGGDGSAKLYAPGGTNKWVAPAGEYRDTIYYNIGDSTYTDTLRHKVVVTFNASGRHVKTTNRVGQSSTFHWNVSGQLDTVAVPPAGATGTKYAIAYANNSNTLLSLVKDPGGRTLTVTDSSNRISSIKDPDSLSTGFSYDASGRMLSRTTRRGFKTRYAYAHGVRLTIDSVLVDTAGATSHTYAVDSMQAWDEHGLATATTGNTAVDTSLGYTKVWGPRTDLVSDTAEFWIDRWGAPVKIQNPLGAVTTLVRGNSSVPALITQVTEPDGRIVKLTWDNLGNLIQQRDSTSQLGAAGLPTRVTRWTYFADSTKFSPDSEIDSTESSALVTRFVYNRWGLLRDVTAPNGHVTHFDFLTTGSDSGLVRAVTEQQVPAWDTTTATLGNHTADRRTAFGFDNLGNVTSDTSPMGHLTRYTRDVLERVTDTYDPEGHHRGRVYDALNRVTQSLVYTGPSTYLTTTFHYAVDNLDSVSDPRGVYRVYRYDAANRRVKVIDDYGHADVSYVDPAGLVDSVRSRLGGTVVIRMTYDAAGRVTKRAWPAVQASSRDSVLYTYDVDGRLLTAMSHLQRDSRTYYSVGQVKTDSQSNADGTLPTTLTYAYDRIGRRTYYVNGRLGNTAHGDSVWYHYTTQGDLATIGVRWRDFTGHPTTDSVKFVFDAVGHRTQLTYPHGILEYLAYDADGALRVVCAQHNNGNYLLPDVYRFTRYQVVADSDGLVDRTTFNNTGLTGFGCSEQQQLPADETASYDSRHQVITQGIGGDSLTYWYDGSGNRTEVHEVLRTNGGNIYYQFEHMATGHNLLTSYYTNNAADSMRLGYNADGSRAVQIPYVADTAYPFGVNNRNYYVDALGRMTGTSERVCEPNADGTCTWQQETNSLACTYDALGRLRFACDNGASAASYDGNNVVRVGSDSSNGGDMTIVQGPGVDDPLFEHNDFRSYLAYFMTDGQGRQLAVGDTTGADLSGDPSYTYAINGGKYAGGITNANNYSATRDSNYQESGLSFFRNRFYDQVTGRWTQEDPMGLAGGSNLYAYAGNNPANFTDPLGLCPYGQKSPDLNVNTCPKDKLGNALRLIAKYGGPKGKEVIKYIAAHPNIDIHLVSRAEIEQQCGRDNDACSKPSVGQFTVPGRTHGEIVVSLAHEIYHGIIRGDECQTEVPVTNDGLDVYSGLPAADRSDQFSNNHLLERQTYWGQAYFDERIRNKVCGGP